MATAPGGAPRNTEITDAGVGPLVSYNQGGPPGALRIPCDVGDLWGTGTGVNNSRNSLFRSLATNWTSMSLALSFAPAMNFQQVHLALYQDDDNYVQAGFAYNTQLNGSGGLVTTLIWEAAGVPNHSSSFFRVFGPTPGMSERRKRSISSRSS